jgi:hypothetical protein
MNDHDRKRRAPFESRIKLPHHDRPAVDAKEDFEKPRTLSESHVQPRQKGTISPPPLKRQRTTYDKFSSEILDSHSKNGRAYLPTSSSALTHRYGNSKTIHGQADEYF